MSTPEIYLPFDPNPNPLEYVVLPGYVDTHCHVIDTKFPSSASAKYTPTDATREHLKKLHDTFGIHHRVLVQATYHGIHNEVFEDALGYFNNILPDSTRAVGAVGPNVLVSELSRLHAVGFRGMRHAFLPHLVDETADPNDILRVGRKMADLRELDGREMHECLYFMPNKWDVMKPIIKELSQMGVKVIIDHMGRPDVNLDPENNPYFQDFTELVANDPNIFVKLSCPERLTLSVRPEDWDNTFRYARTLYAAAPDRTIAGISDWPHPNMWKIIKTPRGDPPTQMVNDGDVYNWTWHFAGGDQQILYATTVANPRNLYTDLAPAPGLRLVPRVDVGPGGGTVLNPTEFDRS